MEDPICLLCDESIPEWMINSGKAVYHEGVAVHVKCLEEKHGEENNDNPQVLHVQEEDRGGVA